MAVVFAHSYYLADAGGRKEPIEAILPFTYTGSIAVKIFFFLSGILVTNSLMRTSSVTKFVISRFFRIYPGLALFVLTTALCIAPLVSTNGYAEYFHNPMVIDYLKGNLTLDIKWYLPGVFENNILKGGINGTLWSIPYEVCSYLVLLSAYIIFGFNNKTILNAIAIAIIIAPVAGYNTYLFINNQNPDIVMTAPCFALGVIYGLNQDRIMLNAMVPIAFIILYFMVENEFAKHMMFYFSVCTASIFIFTRETINKIKVPFDISYGVYLWGFLVAQITYQYFPGLDLYKNQVICLLMSCVVGLMSFYFIEKPSIALSKKINSGVLKNAA
ncbi:acyltransferase [Escherichia coli]|nr:acyltransferase [Escherichia coli]EJE7968982.1 acyltransferase [Escherichia coli]EJE8105234.1 acyltransferase [Escherichia coli]